MKIKVKNKLTTIVYKLITEVGDGYTDDNKQLAKLTDTMNGYIVKFPTWCSTSPDKYISLDYAEAEYLLKLLTHIKENENTSNP